MMKSHIFTNKRRFLWLLLVVFVLLVIAAALTQPYIVHRLSSKIFTAYELLLLKYPNSEHIETETLATSKISIATHYTYHTSDNIETVRQYFEKQRPGFVKMHGSRVISEPTYVNKTCVDETAFRTIFEFINKGKPYIEVYIYPSGTSGTFIRISEHWTSFGFPSWLTGL
jgi:hypothetical protein